MIDSKRLPYFWVRSTGEMALQEMSRAKPCVKNRVESHIEEAVVNFAFEQPAFGQLRVSNELKKRGILVSPGGVRSIWLRHDLESFKKRLKALEAKSAQENWILTEGQLKALEQAKQEKEAHGDSQSFDKVGQPSLKQTDCRY